MAIVGWMYAAFYYIGLEFVAFVLVDVIVKAPLRDATNEQEKRTIWLYESVGLSVLCLLLYSLHHVPYLLLLLTGVTFVYTQLLGRTGLANVVANLRAHWENHLQHEENMKQIERQKQQQQQLQQQALGMAGLNHNTVAELNTFNGHNQQQGYGFNFPFFNKQGSLHYPPNATVVPGQDRPTYSMSPTSASYHDAVKQSRGLYHHSGGGATCGQISQNWNNVNSVPPLESHQYIPSAATTMGRSQYDSGVSSLHHSSDLAADRRSVLPTANLQRRSLRPNVGGKLLPRPLPSSSSIKSKFMNVMGFGPSVPKPVGLVNNGQNMCFINSVVQCLARGPFLVECLTADAAKELECTVAESELLSSLAELLDILTVDPSCSDYKTFNASRFRKATSVLNPSLVTPPGEPMRQQDAAEFLMWLLATVHTILNKNRQALECDPSNLSNEDRFSSPWLAKLKLIYGDLNAHRIKELKDQCRREIAVANGLENESYAEAIQRLSDLEWLTHKQSNDTVVDGLFTGQLVEAYHSLGAGHISVNLQTFNVLPVPMSAPRQASGLVMLEDCFTTFCNIENLCEVMAQPASMAAGSMEQGDVNSAGSPPLVNISNMPRRRNVGGVLGGLGGSSGTPVTRKSLRLLQHQQEPSPIIHQAVSPSVAGYNAPSSLPHPLNIPFSPVVTLSLGQQQQQHLNERLSDITTTTAATFRTSTPIGAGGSEASCGVPAHPTSRLQRRCLLRQLPECLIIQLMRFRFDQVTKTPTKVNTSVSIRLRSFNLRDVIYDTVTQRSDLTAQSGGHVYELYGLCLHLGANSLSHGHYVSYTLDAGKWYRMDDQDVREVNMEYQLGTEEIRQNAYLLFYRRMSSDSV
ncbi:uncharacterized protein LOC101853973 [Aplysia californica]|uniref:Uncharacterized protein LOC101853973 n=1 Tax=Aplysia californica TaxID=6500 RepID=A0ABM0K5U3_APLCA|nr:uncharacterized protein LOC101853973 [Aplysia californica]